MSKNWRQDEVGFQMFLDEVREDCAVKADHWTAFVKWARNQDWRHTQVSQIEAEWQVLEPELWKLDRLAQAEFLGIEPEHWRGDV